MAHSVAAEEMGNNGLFFIYSDHLGSASVLRKSDQSAPFPGSLTRYLPFGSYRGTAPTQTITDRGYTGHKHNDDLGLIYMNARYYVGSIGRFASADTIVPNPTNPQSYNRYSYVRNNPLGYRDPTGHYECQANGICVDAITTLPPSPLPKPPTPLIKFDGHDGHTWTAAERTAVNTGAWQVARSLYEAGGGQFSSPRDAYLSVYGGSVTFYKTGTGSSAGAMGEAKSKNLIHVYHHSTAITSASAGTFWVAHELGHAFNYALVPNQTEPNYNHGQGVIDLAQKGVLVNGALISGATSSTSWLGNYTRGDFEGYQNSSPPHIQNPAYSASEDFADMFSNYVHNSFAVGNAGQARYDFMANHMSSWIALAVSNNE